MADKLKVVKDTLSPLVDKLIPALKNNFKLPPVYGPPNPYVKPPSDWRGAIRDIVAKNPASHHVPELVNGKIVTHPVLRPGSSPIYRPTVSDRVREDRKSVV